MIPIRDSVPRRGIPFVTWGLILFNVLIFLYQLQLTRYELLMLFYTYGIVPDFFIRGNVSVPIIFPPLTLITSMFIHGGFGHLLGNMWILWLFGDNVEERMGSFSFLIFYLLSGVTAGVFHIFTNIASQVPTIGASGAIAGVMAAYLFIYPFARVLAVFPIFFFPYFINLPSFIYIGIWFLVQVYYGTLALGADPAYGGIAWWAHIGGFLFGAFFFRFFLKKRPYVY